MQDPSEYRIDAIAVDASKLHANSAHADLVIVTARRTPVASDLRLVLAIFELAHRPTLTANQFDLIGQQLAGIDAATIDRGDSGERFARIARGASVQLRKATSAFQTRDLASARALDRDDDTLYALNLEIANAATRLELSAEDGRSSSTMP